MILFKSLLVAPLFLTCVQTTLAMVNGADENQGIFCQFQKVRFNTTFHLLWTNLRATLYTTDQITSTSFWTKLVEHPLCFDILA